LALGVGKAKAGSQPGTKRSLRMTVDIPT
jgi:hypothetical protein